MSNLISNVTLIEERHDGPTAAMYTFRTRSGELFIIANCHELIGGMLLSKHLRIFWGGYEQPDEDGLSHWVNAFIHKYQDHYDLVILDE
ncbi:hypothetical protein LJC45_01565 [Alistipes sp. OttesenSCG-928-B03]|nr:hypothetical protein [Alistipes sp. OttesenSCG-928-B03]